MKEYNFYEYYEEDDKIDLYSEDIQIYFDLQYNILINSIDFDSYQNVVLYIENNKKTTTSSQLEKRLLEEIEHLNDVEVKDMKIILTFDCDKIELF